MNLFRRITEKNCWLVVISSALVLASCASSKKSQIDPNEQMMQMMQMMMKQQQQLQHQEQVAKASEGKLGLGEEVAKSPAQIYAEDPTADKIRAWALFNGFEDDNLEAVAAQIARGNVSNTLEVLVEDALSNFVDRVTQQGATSEGVAKKKIQDAKVASKLKTVSENLIKGAKVVKSNRYRQKDGTYTAYVCVELDPAVVANAIKNEQDIINAISFNEQMKIMWKSKMFDEEMKSSFEKLKEKRAEASSSAQ